MSKNYITDELGTKGLDKQYAAYFKTLEVIDTTVKSIKRSCYSKPFYKAVHCNFIRNLVQKLQNDEKLYHKTDELRDLLVMNYNTTFLSENLKESQIRVIASANLEVIAAVSNATDDLLKEFYTLF